MLWKNELCFDQEEMLKMGLILHAFEFLDMLIPMAQVLRLYIQGYMYSLSGNCSDFQALFEHFFPVEIDFFLIFWSGELSKQQKFHIGWFWLGKMHQNGLSGT